MIKQFVTPFFILVSLLSAPLLTTEVDAQAPLPSTEVKTTLAVAPLVAKATTPTVKKTVAKTPVKKTTTTKKKVTKKKKPKVIAAPALFTPETAPHSPKPVAKKKTITKKK